MRNARPGPPKVKNKKHIKIVVTAGPTVEPIDPVRFLSNFSTGVMGYEIARACRRKGYKTVLITGPVGIRPPAGVEVAGVMTAKQMKEAVTREIKDANALIMAAAVCDFGPAKKACKKIKKKNKLRLNLVKTPDILAGIGCRKGLVKIGFALETDKAVKNAKAKLRDKKLDVIVLNAKSAEEDPFGAGAKKFVIIDRSSRLKEIKDVSKRRFARILVEEMQRFLR